MRTYRGYPGHDYDNKKFKKNPTHFGMTIDERYPVANLLPYFTNNAKV